MDKYDWIGSPTRDAFKFWHKQKRGKYYGGDIDFCLVHKLYVRGEKKGGIVAFLDFKTRTDKITFAEVMAYNDLLAKGYDVFIIRANVVTRGANCPHCSRELPRAIAVKIDWANSFTLFTIQKYIGGDWRPFPVRIELEAVKQDISEDEYWEWEKEIRERYVALSSSIPGNLAANIPPDL